MNPFINTIEELKENREVIIDQIKIELGCDDMTLVKKAMNMIVCWLGNTMTQQQWSIYDAIEEAVKVTSTSIDMTVFARTQEMHRKGAMNQRPSSMR